MSGRDRRCRWGRSSERSPLRPARHQTFYGVYGQIPRPPGVDPPPYDPFPTYPGAGYQPHQVPQCREGLLSPRSKMRTATLICISSIFLIILAQAMAFTICYDLPTKLVDYSRATARMWKEKRLLGHERHLLEREKEEWKKERERWEKAREDRVPQGAFWDLLWPALDCRAYGKREYWAALQNIPEDWTDMEACMNMPIEIKGVSVRRPYRCGYAEGSPHILGYWMVDWDQVDCKPWHADVTDMGCTNAGSGTRRIEAWVVGINDKHGQDWRLLCESTPFTWDHVTYNSATHCEAGIFGRKYAMWDVPDPSC